jgi:hypothetical protein
MSVRLDVYPLLAGAGAGAVATGLYAMHPNPKSMDKTLYAALKNCEEPCTRDDKAKLLYELFMLMLDDKGKRISFEKLSVDGIIEWRTHVTLAEDKFAENKKTKGFFVPFAVGLAAGSYVSSTMVDHNRKLKQYVHDFAVMANKAGENNVNKKKKAFFKIFWHLLFPNSQLDEAFVNSNNDELYAELQKGWDEIQNDTTAKYLKLVDVKPAAIEPVVAAAAAGDGGQDGDASGDEDAPKQTEDTPQAQQPGLFNRITSFLGRGGGTNSPQKKP